MHYNEVFFSQRSEFGDSMDFSNDLPVAKPDPIRILYLDSKDENKSGINPEPKTILLRLESCG